MVEQRRDAARHRLPPLWEDQDAARGGWDVDAARSGCKAGTRAGTLAHLFHNPSLPTLDDYYEPWTYRYRDLFDAPAGDDSAHRAPGARS